MWVTRQSVYTIIELCYNVKNINDKVSCEKSIILDERKDMLWKLFLYKAITIDILCIPIFKLVLLINAYFSLTVVFSSSS